MTDFIIPTETIEWGAEGKRNKIEVRGLSLNDFTHLFTHYGKDVDNIFNFIDRVNSGGDLDAKVFGSELIVKAPMAVASLIALAADMPDRATQVARMPLPVQLRAMEHIYRMTVEEAGGLPDFLALVLRIAKGVNRTIPLLSSQQNQISSVSTGT